MATPKQIDRLLDKLDDYGYNAGKVVLAAPLKRGKAGYTKADAIRMMAEQRGETQREIREMLDYYGPGDGTFGVLFRAEGANSGLSEGDLVWLHEGTTPGSGWEHLGEVHYFRPADDVRWKEVAVMDDYAEIIGPVTEANLYAVLEQRGY